MFKKVAAIFLALFFLASSSHLSFATHFCGGHVFKHSFLLDTSDFGCGMEKDRDFTCEDHSQMTEKDCCDTQLIQYSIKDNFQTSKVEVNIKHATSLLNVVIILFSLPQNEEEFITYKTYKVPLPEKDIPVLFQSFLI